MAVRHEQDAAPLKSSRPASGEGATDGSSQATRDHRRAAEQAAGRTVDDTIDTGRRAAEAIGDTTDKIGEEVASATKRVGDHMNEATRRNAESASAAIEQGTEALSKTQRRVAETVRTQTDQLASSVAEAGDVYRETAELTTEDARLLMAASGVVAGGFQDMQRKILEIVQDNFQHAMRAPQEAMRCNTLPQLAALQRSWMMNGMNRLLTSSLELMRISERVAQDASRPLQQRVQELERETGHRSPERTSRAERHPAETGPHQPGKSDNWQHESRP